MKFRNPWIDPRIVQVRPAAAQAYLRQRGWKPLTTGQPNLLRFEGPPGKDGSPTVQVPLLEQGRDYPQRVIELITDLALAEERYAVEVLDDILRQPQADPPAPVHGTTPSTPPEPAAS
jgi:hypothetical protein